MLKFRFIDTLTQAAGLKNCHGLRHAYAQARYFEMTDWRAPIDAGKLRHKLSKAECQLDQRARKAIALELGHSRASIAKNYLG